MCVCACTASHMQFQNVSMLLTCRGARAITSNLVHRSWDVIGEASLPRAWIQEYRWVHLPLPPLGPWMQCARPFFSRSFLSSSFFPHFPPTQSLSPPPPYNLLFGTCLHNASTACILCDMFTLIHIIHCATPWLKTCLHSYRKGAALRLLTASAHSFLA